MKYRLAREVIKILFGCCGILFAIVINLTNVDADTTATFTVVAGDGVIANSNLTTNVSGQTAAQQIQGTNSQTAVLTNSTNLAANNQQTSASSGDLQLQSVPNLNFKRVSASAIYKGASISLTKADNLKKANTAGALSVADFRGWVVSAQATAFSNGKTTITPAITLHFKQTLLNKRIEPVKITSKVAVPVAESSMTPTQGAGIANLISSISTTLDFKDLPQKQLVKFKPGTYHGQIVWSLNNTASTE
ncbi:hypothetical protein [Liquorilactobacillus vini]|uniref:WxL domain-containing protein n=1 Tax=Liquorilactobacillus vini DSM 20605 TaxID=1133569 RepID=A0A0R2BYY6_9LACO|nr:hypothetical protein [Liquorilactobacillus vini]KRM84375.1 hypothetical protein FD21_GL002036 [Liquorilactobacillus vini DSM 20605]